MRLTGSLCRGSGAEHLEGLLGGWRHNVFELLLEAQTTKQQHAKQQADYTAQVHNCQLQLQQAAIHDTNKRLSQLLVQAKLCEDEANQRAAAEQQQVELLKRQLLVQSQHHSSASKDKATLDALAAMLGTVPDWSNALTQSMQTAASRLQQLSDRVQFATTRLPVVQVRRLTGLSV